MCRTTSENCRRARACSPRSCTPRSCLPRARPSRAKCAARCARLTLLAFSERRILVTFQHVIHAQQVCPARAMRGTRTGLTASQRSHPRETSQPAKPAAAPARSRASTTGSGSAWGRWHPVPSCACSRARCTPGPRGVPASSRCRSGRACAGRRRASSSGLRRGWWLRRGRSQPPPRQR